MTKRLSIWLGWLLVCGGAFAAEVIPPKPVNFFNDYAHVTSAATDERLNHALADFERQTSIQLVVAVYPKMESESSIDDYAVRVARSWQIGQKGKNNGVLLLVFVQDHKLTIQTGYGMEGALPDLTCHQIIANEITPRFKQGDYDGGLSAGVAAIIAATKGEYKGTGRTVAEGQGNGRNSPDQHASWFVVIFFVIIVFFIFIPVFSQRRRGGGFLTGFLLGSGGFSGWSGGNGGGGWSGGGGGNDSFSGGGGSFGGGGASGSW